MLYPYVELDDQTKIAYSELRDDYTIRIEIERPRDWGFDSAGCVIPSYEWKHSDGFTDEELSFLNGFLRNNAPLIYEMAEEAKLSA